MGSGCAQRNCRDWIHLQILKRIHHPVDHSLHPASHLIGHSLRVKLNFNEIIALLHHFTIVQAVIEFAR